MILLAAVVLFATALVLAVVFRGWPSFTFNDMAEPREGAAATGIVIDPHRWEDEEEDE